MKIKLYIFSWLLIALPCLVSCHISNPPDAYVIFSWNINGWSASESECRAVGGDRLIAEEYNESTGGIAWSGSFPCSQGMAKTPTRYYSYTGVTLRFRLIDHLGRNIATTDWHYGIVAPGPNWWEIDFEVEPQEQFNASIYLQWTINDKTATPSTCEEVGGRLVRIEEDVDHDGVADWSYDMDCGYGSAETPNHFTAGDRVFVRFLLAGDSEVLSQTNWESFIPQEGRNEYIVNFKTSSIPSDNKAYLSFDWTIHYLNPDSQLCEKAGGDKVQLRVDHDNDGESDIYFEFDCDLSNASTEEMFEEGEKIWIKFALVSPEKTDISITQQWSEINILRGENHLGTVNFIVGDYGPLRIDLRWQVDEGDNETFGRCDDTSPPVEKIGYRLMDEDEQVIEQVDIDESPVSCQEYLEFDLLPYGNYTISITGQDISGSISWEGICSFLVVDSYEPSSNLFTCEIGMANDS